MHKYIRDKITEKGGKKMSKKITVRFEDSEIEKLEKLAKLEGKNLSQFIRTKLKESIQSEMRETSLLEKLIRMIENLSVFQSQMQMKIASQHDDEFQRELYKILLFLTRTILLHAELIIVDHMKRKTFKEEVAKMKAELNIEI